MRKATATAILLAVCAVHVTATCPGPAAFFNEFHYNDETDTANEGVEIMVPSGESLGDYQFQAFKGSDGSRKKRIDLDDGTQVTSTTLVDGTMIVHVPAVLQNSNDGFALLKDCSGTMRVVEFLCYQARFVPIAGTDIFETNCSLVVETIPFATEPMPTGNTFQRLGDGTSTTWEVAPSTWGSLNSGQSSPPSSQCCIDCAAAACTSWPEAAEPTDPPENATYYLNQASGSDVNDGLSPATPFQTIDKCLEVLQPGMTLKIMGTVTNPSYDPTYSFSAVDDAHLWHGENSVVIADLHGTPSKWITITAYDESTVLKGDGANILRVRDSSYIRIIGFTIEGEVDRIPYETAKALQFVFRETEGGAIQYRVDPNLTDAEINALTLPTVDTVRASYTDTRGLYMSDVHHLEVRGNRIHHAPGNGLRCAYCEYVDIIENDIHSNARKSYSGTHGLVVTYALDDLPQEEPQNYRVRILRNLVHHNYNEIFSWVGTKTFIHAAIDEGKGISLQRNQEFQNGGRILVANNLAYWNGYSGIHSNDGDNVDMIGNTAYMNSFTNTIWYNATGGEQTGNNIGISVSDGRDCKVINNIAVVDTSFLGMPISVSGSHVDGFQIADNLVFGIAVNQPVALKTDTDLVGLEVNTTIADPLFVESGGSNPFHPGLNFRLRADSPAVGRANPAFTPCEDLYRSARLAASALGAIEFASPTLPLAPDSDNATLCYAVPYTGFRAAGASEWGSMQYGHCELTSSWEELLPLEAAGEMATGGLGKLMTDEYEVWACLEGHACAPSGSFCFVFNEDTEGWVPWGPNSALGLF